MNNTSCDERLEIGCLGLALYIIMILSLIFIFTRKCEGQGAGYVLLQPIDKAIGIRGDYYPLKIREPGDQRSGIYHSFSYGSGGLYRLYGLGHHIKISTGVLIPLPEYDGFKYVLSLGASYHLLTQGVAGDFKADPRILRPWSFELGYSVKMKRVAVCVATDILRWEPCVGFGVLF